MCTVRSDVKLCFVCFAFFGDVGSDFTGIKDDDIGTVYQDSESMAAVLVNHDAEDDALVLVINLPPAISPSFALSLSGELPSLASSRNDSFFGRVSRVPVTLIHQSDDARRLAFVELIMRRVIASS